MTRLAPLVLPILLGGAAATALAEAPSATSERRARVLAEFEGGAITVGDLEDAIARKAPHVRAHLQEREARLQLLRDMVVYELLVQEARRRGYADHFRVTDAMAVESVNLLEDEVKSAVEPEALGQAELQAYYEQHRERLSRAALRRASFVRFESREQAEAFRPQAQAMTVDVFRRHAARRGMGGELGYVDADGHPGGDRSADKLDPELTRAAHALARVGDTSEPLPYQGGFIIMRLTASTEPMGMTLKDVEHVVREQLARQRQDAAMDALRKKLAAEHPAQIERGLIERVKVDTSAPDIPMGFPAAPKDPAMPDVVVEPDDA